MADDNYLDEAKKQFGISGEAEPPKPTKSIAIKPDAEKEGSIDYLDDAKKQFGIKSELSVPSIDLRNDPSGHTFKQGSGLVSSGALGSGRFLQPDVAQGNWSEYGNVVDPEKRKALAVELSSYKDPKTLEEIQREVPWYKMSDSPEQVAALFAHEWNKPLSEKGAELMHGLSSGLSHFVGGTVPDIAKGGWSLAKDISGLGSNKVTEQVASSIRASRVLGDAAMRAAEHLYTPGHEMAESGHYAIDKARYAMASPDDKQKELETAKENFRKRLDAKQAEHLFNEKNPAVLARWLERFSGLKMDWRTMANPYGSPYAPQLSDKDKAELEHPVLKQVSADLLEQFLPSEETLASETGATIDEAKAARRGQALSMAEDAFRGALEGANRLAEDPRQVGFVEMVTPLNSFGVAGKLVSELAAPIKLGIDGIRRIGKSAEEYNLAASSTAANAAKAAADRELRSMRPGKIEQNLRTLGRFADYSKDRIGGALENIPTAVKVGGLATGGALAGALTSDDPLVGAYKGAGLGLGAYFGAATANALKFGSAMAAVPKVGADLLEAGRLSTGNMGRFATAESMTAASDATKSLIRKVSLGTGGKGIDWIAKNGLVALKHNVDMAPLMLALGVYSQDDAQQFGSMMAEGAGWSLVHGQLLGGMRGQDPVANEMRRRSDARHAERVLLASSPEHRANVNATNWDRVVEGSASQVAAAKGEYDRLVSETPDAPETTAALNQLKFLEDAHIKNLKASPQTRQAFHEGVKQAFGKADLLVNGALSPNKNINIELLTGDQIVSKIIAANPNYNGKGQPMTLEQAEVYKNQRGMFVKARDSENPEEGRVAVDPFKDSAIVNLDKVLETNLITGEAIPNVVAHEVVGHGLFEKPEYKQKIAAVYQQLFGSEYTDADGTIKQVVPGMYSRQDILDMYFNKYIRGKTPEAKAINLESISKANGLWDYATGAPDPSRVIDYMRLEILADAHMGTLYGDPNSPLQSVISFIEGRVSSDVLKSALQALHSIAGPNAFEDYHASTNTGANFTPEVLRQIKAVEAALEKYEGHFENAERSDAMKPPMASKAEVLKSRELMHRYHRDTGKFETKPVAIVTDAAGNVVSKTDIKSTDVFDGAWNYNQDEVTGAVQPVQVSGYGDMPESIQGISVPVGGKLEVQREIVYDEATGKPIERSNAETREIIDTRNKAIRQAIDGAGDLNDINRFREVPGEGEDRPYKGKLLPEQRAAIAALPESVVPASMKEKIFKIADAIAGDDGSVWDLDYAARINERGGYQAFSPEERRMVPVSLNLSKDGNFYVGSWSISGLNRKIDLWRQHLPSYFSLWGGDVDAFRTQFRDEFLNNLKPIHSDQYGNLGPRPGRTGLDADPAIAKQKADIFHALLGVSPESINPEVRQLPRPKFTRKEKKRAKQSDPDSIFRSYRLDSMASLNESPAPFKYPIPYGLTKIAFMPEGAAEPERERRPLGIDPALLRGLSALRKPEAAPVDAPLGDNRKNVGVRFMPADDYRGEHKAPDEESGAPFHEVTKNIYPPDFYNLNYNTALQYYGSGDTQSDSESLAAIRAAQGKPNARVKVYRAVPKFAETIDPAVAAERKAEFKKYLKLYSLNTWSEDFKQKMEQARAALPQEITSINAGDWVTPSKTYAVDHGESALNGEYKILSKTVPASHLHTEGNSLSEFGYNPPKSDNVRFMPESEKDATMVADGFYSKAGRVLLDKMPIRASADQIRGILDPQKGSGVKPDEMKWSGINQFIDATQAEKGFVTKDDVKQFLKDSYAAKFETQTMADKPVWEVFYSDGSSEVFNSEKEAEKAQENAEYNYVEFLEDNNFYKIQEEVFNDENGESKSGKFQIIDTTYDEPTTSIRHNNKEFYLQEYYNSEKEAQADLSNLYKEIAKTENSIEQKEVEETQYSHYKLPGGTNYEETVLRMPGVDYTSSHFKDVPNYVAHMRTQDFGNGRLIEELQSDLHQAARKKDPITKKAVGYKGAIPFEEIRLKIESDISNLFNEQKRLLEAYKLESKQLRELDARNENLNTNELKLALSLRQRQPDLLESINDTQYGIDAAKKELEDHRSGKKVSYTKGVADAPFQKSSEWSLQLFKHALQKAVADDKEWIGWTGGEAVADRFDLSKKASSVDYIPSTEQLRIYDLYGHAVVDKLVPIDKLPDYIGEPVADKLLETAPYKTGSGKDAHKLSGIELKAGGEGMKAFYDKIVPLEIGKYVKQWGAKVEPSKIKDVDIWKVQITPEMRSSVEGGQPRFMPDSEHAAAHEAGDEAKGRELVRKAAERAGYSYATYHGTSDEFNVFKPSEYGVLGSGIYTGGKEQAELYGKPISLYGKHENPITFNSVDEIWAARNKAKASGLSFTDYLKKEGYDSIIETYASEDGEPTRVFFDPSQVKSADPFTYDNTGKLIPLSERFNPASSDIRFMPEREERDIKIAAVDPSTIPFKEKDQERGRVNAIKQAYGNDPSEIDWQEQPKPIVSIDSDGNMQVEDGHHRMSAFKELGYKEIPAIIVPKDKWDALEAQKGFTGAGIAVAEQVGDEYTAGQPSYQGGRKPTEGALSGVRFMEPASEGGGVRFMPPESGVELEPGDAETLPVYHYVKDGKLSYKGKDPVVAVQNYELIESPFIEEYNGPAAKDPTPLDFSKLAYNVSGPEMKKINAAIASGAVDSAADMIVQLTNNWVKDPAIAAGMGWYSRMRTNLLNALGSTGRELLSQLLGATSAQTPVDINFLQAMDAYEGVMSGRYDRNRFLYLEMNALKAKGELNKVIEDRGYIDILKAKSEKLKKALKKATTKADKTELTAQIASIQELIEKPADKRTVAQRESIMAVATNMMPLRSNGQKFNANSHAVLKVIAGTWLNNRDAPKTPNFAGNLSGRTVEATIDLWAARTLRRIMYEGRNTPWRIQPKAEQGVTNGDFALGQEVLKRAAKDLKINPDDLQAILWFGEKGNWEINGWTKNAGAEKSSFDKMFNIFFPAGKKPLTFKEASDMLAAEKLAKETAKKEKVKAEKKAIADAKKAAKELEKSENGKAAKPRRPKSIH